MFSCYELPGVAFGTGKVLSYRNMKFAVTPAVLFPAEAL